MLGKANHPGDSLITRWGESRSAKTISMAQHGLADQPIDSILGEPIPTLRSRWIASAKSNVVDR